MKSRWSIIWAVVLIVGGLFLLVQNMGLLGKLSAPLWSVLFAALGLVFLLNFIMERTQWWSLIPGCILLGIGLVSFLAEAGAQGEWMGSLMLFSIGLPFLLIYLVQTRQGRRDAWWALIPGGILTFLAIVVVATLRLPGEAIGTLVLWGIALPFVGVYLADRQKNWWALIPAGVLVVIGLIPILTLATESPNIVGAAFFLGLAAVFGLLYALKRSDAETAWAVYPAVILAVIGVGVLLLGSNWWPIVLVGIGAALLVRSLRAAR